MSDIAVDVQVTGHAGITDAVMAQVGALFSNPNFWLFMASMLVTIVLMQGAKALMKTLMKKRTPKFRRWSTFILAFIIGYWTARFFLHTDSETERNWAVLCGVLNPFVYWVALQYAVIKNRMILLSVLKMRPVRRTVVDDKVILSLDDTQSFMTRPQGPKFRMSDRK